MIEGRNRVGKLSRIDLQMLGPKLAAQIMSEATYGLDAAANRRFYGVGVDNTGLDLGVVDEASCVEVGGADRDKAVVDNDELRVDVNLLAVVALEVMDPEQIATGCAEAVDDLATKAVGNDRQSRCIVISCNHEENANPALQSRFEAVNEGAWPDVLIFDVDIVLGAVDGVFKGLRYGLFACAACCREDTFRERQVDLNSSVSGALSLRRLTFEACRTAIVGEEWILVWWTGVVPAVSKYFPDLGDSGALDLQLDIMPARLTWLVRLDKAFADEIPLALGAIVVRRVIPAVVTNIDAAEVGRRLGGIARTRDDEFLVVRRGWNVGKSAIQDCVAADLDDLVAELAIVNSVPEAERAGHIGSRHVIEKRFDLASHLPDILDDIEERFAAKRIAIVFRIEDLPTGYASASDEEGSVAMRERGPQLLEIAASVDKRFDAVSGCVSGMPPRGSCREKPILWAQLGNRMLAGFGF